MSAGVLASHRNHRFLIVGKSGQLARALVRRGRLSGIECIALGRESLDLADAESLAARIVSTVRSHDITAVINAAAFTAVDLAETQEAEAFRINAEAAAELASGAEAVAVPLIHVSSDYVFDGSASNPYEPHHRTGPLGAYGRSKLAGEWAVRANSSRHAIVRTAWVYGIEGSNFLRTMLRLASQRDVVPVVSDQHGSPTEVDELAQGLIVIAAKVAKNSELSGIYHYCGTGQTSWAGFARAIFEEAQVRHPAKLWPKVEPIPTEAYPTAAMRPRYSVLDTKQTTEAFGLEIAPWRKRLADVMERLEWEEFL